MALSTLLAKVRNHLDHWWIIITFGCIYLLSQISIGILLDTLNPIDMAKLQLSGFDKAYYLQQFQNWQDEGVLTLYQAHFIFDDIHFLWYSLALTACLSKAMNNSKADKSYNFTLILPSIAGLFDSFENHIQHVFLSTQDFSSIIDPLPLLSTFASISKWSLVSITLIFLLYLSIKTLYIKNYKE